MKSIATSLVLVLLSVSAFAEVTVSGRAKAFKGPEGEVITMIPVTVDGTEKMLVHTKNTYGINDGKSLIYTVRHQTIGFPDPKADEKSNAMFGVLSKRGEDQTWTYADRLANDENGKRRFIGYPLTYSEELSAKIKTKDLVKNAQEYTEKQ